MTSEYERKILSHYRHFAAFMRDQGAIMDREEERRRRYEEEDGEVREEEEPAEREYKYDREEREEEDEEEEEEEEEEESDTDLQQEPSPPLSPAPQQPPSPTGSSQQSMNELLIPPTLVQCEAGLAHLTSTGPHDREVFTDIICYQYSTRNNPQLQTAFGRVADVINALYIRVDGLETRNAVLLARLESVQSALVMKRQKDLPNPSYHLGF